MSVVTTVVIISSEYGDELDKNLAKLNSYIEEHGRLGTPFAPTKDGGAGSKNPERNIMIGGFNYLNRSQFAEFFKSLKMHDTVLVMAPDQGDSYDIVPSETELEIK